MHHHQLEDIGDYRKVLTKALGKIPQGDKIWTEDAAGEHLELYRPFPVKVGRLGVGLINHKTQFKIAPTELTAFLSTYIEVLINNNLKFQIVIFGKFNEEKSKYTIRFNKSLSLELECLAEGKNICKEFITRNAKELNVDVQIIAEGDDYSIKSSPDVSVSGISRDFSGKNPHGLTLNHVTPSNLTKLPGWLNDVELNTGLGIQYDANSSEEEKFHGEIYVALSKSIKTESWMTLFQLTRQDDIIKKCIYSECSICPVFSWRSKSYEDYKQVDLVHSNGKYELIEYQGRVPYA